MWRINAYCGAAAVHVGAAVDEVRYCGSCSTRAAIHKVDKGGGCRSTQAAVHEMNYIPAHVLRLVYCGAAVVKLRRPQLARVGKI